MSGRGFDWRCDVIVMVNMFSDTLSCFTAGYTLRKLDIDSTFYTILYEGNQEVTVFIGDRH